ncbi:MAG: cytochrome P450 [Crocosphaera sp.]|nr:cytochrome P450 [Crocosphaera sp.]
MTNPLPKGPTHSALWQLIRWIKEPLSYQQECLQHYGDIFTLNMKGFAPFVIIGNPLGVQEIFSQNPDNFDVGRGNEIAEPLFGTNSLFFYDGQRHQRERKLLMPSFHGQSLQNYAQSICDIAVEVASQCPENKPVIIREVMQTISLEVILKVVFGISEGERYQAIKPLIAQMLDVTDSPSTSSFLFFKFLQKDWGKWSPWGRIQYTRRQIYHLLQEEIEERRRHKKHSHSDVLSLMMAAKDEKGQSLTDDELKDELMTLLFAGHETTATTMSWAFYQILSHPSILEKMRQELEENTNHLTPLETAKLPYLSAVCQEVLRMYPILPIIFPRITKTKMTIMGHEFAPETWLTPSIYLVHYREDLYPEPEKFKPERFLEKKFANYEYLPFGGGTRRCLGYALAELEMKLVLASIISNYSLDLTTQKPVKPQRRGFTISPAGGVPVILSKRLFV